MTSIKEGTLRYQNKNWKEVDAKIVDKCLIISKKGKDSEIENIDLTIVSSVEKAEKCRKPNSFVIDTDTDNHTFSCQDEEDLENWLKAIKKAISGTSNNDEPETISVNDFEILKVLGKGGYGKVQLVRYKEDNEIYAMKSMSKSDLAEEGLITRTMAERQALLSIKHPFIVSAKFAFQTASKVFLVTEYVPGGELYTRIRSERRFSTDRIRLYGAMLVSAIGYLHGQNIAHRDLKPENILIDKDGYLKLTDFGFVKVGLQNTSYTSTFCGTPDYIAPEIVTGQVYNKSVDWWSIGILFYEMVYGKPPFTNANTNLLYKSIIEDDVVFDEGVDIDPDLKDLIEKLLMKNPEERIGTGFKDSSALEEHPFFESIDFDELEQKKYQMEWMPEITDMTDVSQFDERFTRETAQLTPETQAVAADVQNAFNGFTFKNDAQV